MSVSQIKHGNEIILLFSVVKPFNSFEGSWLYNESEMVQ